MSDLISRAEAIEALCREECGFAQKECTVGNCYDVEIIEGVPSVRSQWIPVSERLPSQQQTVLIQDFGEITIGYLNAENRWRDLTNQADYLKGVEAWMPLPEPYKGG